MAAALFSFVCVLLVVLPLPPPPVEAAVPGTFFWNRRPSNASRKAYNLDKQHDNKEPIVIINIRNVKKPTLENFKSGYVVIISGFKLVTAFATLVKYAEILGDAYPHMHPCYSDFWTTAYRWMYRYVKMLPEYAFGKYDNFVDTHRVWRKRYFYLDKFIPEWIRPFLIKLCVHPLSFKKEELVWKKYVKYIQPHWGKYFIYPSKVFNNYNSMRPPETVENLDDSTASNQ